MGYLLGIDVGTTRTAAATGRADAGLGDFEIVNLGDRASSVPSVLYLGKDGIVLVGDAAERRATTDPDRVVREFKRRIGDPTPIVVAGRTWAPEELSARLVRWVVDRVAEREGGPADRIAITHPASWGAHKKDRLSAALTAHGITASFLAEPQAAALHYAAAERVESGSTIAVYDLGGGTFDAAVVHKDGRGFTLTGRPEGVERLGGIDFDEVVFEHVRAGLPEAFEGLDDTDPARAGRGGRGPARVHRGQGGAEQRHRGVHPGADAGRAGLGAAAPQRVRGDDPAADRGDGRRAAPRGHLGRAGARPALGRAAGRRLVADPAGRRAGLRAAGAPGRGGRRPEERDRQGRGAVAAPGRADGHRGRARCRCSARPGTRPRPARSRGTRRRRPVEPGRRPPGPPPAGPAVRAAGPPMPAGGRHGGPPPPGPPRPAYPDRPQAVYRPPRPGERSAAARPQPGHAGQHRRAVRGGGGDRHAVPAAVDAEQRGRRRRSRTCRRPATPPPTTTTTLAPTTTSRRRPSRRRSRRRAAADHPARGPAAAPAARRRSHDHDHGDHHHDHGTDDDHDDHHDPTARPRPDPPDPPDDIAGPDG